jgi:hypothetical protein
MIDLWIPSWMQWRHVRWHLSLLLLGLIFIMLYLWLESRDLSPEETASMQRGATASFVPVTLPGATDLFGASRIGDAGHSDGTTQVGGVAMASSAAKGILGDRVSAAQSAGSSGDPKAKSSSGVAPSPSSKVIVSGAGGLQARNRSVNSAMPVPGGVAVMAPAAATDLNVAPTGATASGNTAMNTTKGSGSLGESPLSPASTASPPSGVDPALKETKNGTVTGGRQATAEDLYRAKYGWATYGEFIRRQKIDQYEGRSSTDAGTPLLDSTSPSSGQ